MWVDRIAYERQRLKMAQDERARQRAGARRPRRLTGRCRSNNSSMTWSLTFGDVVFTDQGATR